MDELTEEKLLAKEFAPDSEQQITELLLGDTELAAFLIAWIKNSFNASVAYKSLHPNVSKGSARVLGCRKLSQLIKVNPAGILNILGLDIEIYIAQLKEGLNATIWNNFTGLREADHKTRRIYHEALGKLLDLEK